MERLTDCAKSNQGVRYDIVSLISSNFPSNIFWTGLKSQIECLTLLEQWTDDWAMTVNAAKTTYSIFSLSTNIPNLRLRINNSLLEKENYPKYLGVTFDPRLTWCKQIETVQKNAVRRTLLLKKLAGTSWGADMKLLKKTYVGYVRPVMEYGIAAWGTASKTNF
ncbi:RNA-directed DNA polymerase from mobile element jockey [Elysia marginata]|uniref:RNA-directed DNA polymerase from mobile element jockey n=1 Tax=Elysia marginata TaxID=1093978 RepID=A0AAV4J6M0_9GAST|nr:RNA-directed DNA polymerase from mobile element jockey [Elysia marginata]